jgi:hypothetical protein
MDKSEFFDVTLGLKQGEPLSPILFILVVNNKRKVPQEQQVSANQHIHPKQLTYM